MIVGHIDESMIPAVPDRRSVDPSAYHIIHEGNLDSLFETGYLYSDAMMRASGIQHKIIWYTHTKGNRLDTPIPLCSDLSIGDCVPFYLCPRSVMLYVIYRADSPQLATHEGQTPVIHLRFNLRRVCEWARQNQLRTFITNANAVSAHAEVFDDIRALTLLDWDSIEARRWTDGAVKSMKESELLVERQVSMKLLEEIGVIDPAHQQVVNGILSKYEDYKGLPVNIHPEWYY